MNKKVKNCQFLTLEKYVSFMHKVLTYVEYRAVSGVFQNIEPPPPSPGVEGGGGSIFWKTLDIGLASYSMISLRFHGIPGARWHPRTARRSLNIQYAV
jgi:hypothetical protein